MLTVEDVFASDISYRHSDVEVVSGFLVVSPHLTFLCPSDESTEKAILVVAPGLIEKWTGVIPGYAGSMVAFAGEATVTGNIAMSGLAPCPYVFYRVASIRFCNQHGMEARYEPSASDHP